MGAAESPKGKRKGKGKAKSGQGVGGKEQGEGRPGLWPLVSPHWSIFLAIIYFPFARGEERPKGVWQEQGEEGKGKALLLAAGLTALVDYSSSGFYFSFGRKALLFWAKGPCSPRAIGGFSAAFCGKLEEEKRKRKRKKNRKCAHFLGVEDRSAEGLVYVMHVQGPPSS